MMRAPALPSVSFEPDRRLAVVVRVQQGLHSAPTRFLRNEAQKVGRPLGAPSVHQKNAVR